MYLLHKREGGHARSYYPLCHKDCELSAGAGEILKLDVSHAVSGWLSQPGTNLGLRLSLEEEERRPGWLERAELVLETKESLLRQRREAVRRNREKIFQLS